jgi:5'-3' exoribonuclease 1
MQVIRGRKSQKGYDPNESHCMYGLDADLIMLSLMSHEPNFVLLREELIFERINKKNEKKEVQMTKHDNFQLIYITLIREYLDLELQNVKKFLSFSYDLERIIDDYILMCFFCGNDFIPHSPTLDIREGAIPYMLDVYKTILPSLGGYLIENGKLNYERIGKFLAEISKGEEDIMEKRLSQKIETERKASKFSRRKKKPTEIIEEEVEDDEEDEETPIFEEDDLIYENLKLQNISHLIHEQEFLLSSDIEKGFQQDLQIPDLDSPTNQVNDILGLKVEKKVDDILLECAKKGKLGLDYKLWRREYYKRKFKIDVDDSVKMNELLLHYTEAITWVYQYYFKGCSSWGWYYPYV